MKRMTAWVLVIVMAATVSLSATAKGDPVSVTARSAVLMDQATGKVLFEKDGHRKLYPASVTKIMTLLLVMEALDQKKIRLTDKVQADAESVSKGGSQIWLKEGETMTVDELLRATAIGSANDACCALAVHLAGSETAFVQLMNEKAASLGMKDTVFENCTGLDDDTTTHLTSAYDIALMSRALLEYKLIQKYSTVWMDSLRNGETQLVNTNKLVRFYPGTTGLKTGTTTKAGCCVSASALRDGLHLIAVVLQAQASADRFSDAKAMLDWGFATFESVTPAVDPALLHSVAVRQGVAESVSVDMETMHPLLLKKGEKEKLKLQVQLPDDVQAPVEERQRLGELSVLLDQKTVAQYPLYAKTEVRALTLTDVISRLLLSLLTRSKRNFVVNG